MGAEDCKPTGDMEYLEGQCRACGRWFGPDRKQATEEQTFECALAWWEFTERDNGEVSGDPCIAVLGPICVECATVPGTTQAAAALRARHTTIEVVAYQEHGPGPAWIAGCNRSHAGGGGYEVPAVQPPAPGGRHPQERAPWTRIWRS